MKGLLFIVSGSLLLYNYLKQKQQIAWFFYLNKKSYNNLHEYYSSNFDYYNLLVPKEKRKFIGRVVIFSKSKHLQIHDDLKELTNEIHYLVFGSLAQITFGFSNFQLERFTKIIIQPSSFYSRIADAEVKGLTIGTGYIFYSWTDFLHGYHVKSDRVNLALHELAHALYVEHFHEFENENWNNWLQIAEIEIKNLEYRKDVSFFREYGRLNIHEFWAINVECFFEDPIQFKEKYSNLYDQTSKLLNQDLANLFLRNSRVI